MTVEAHKEKIRKSQIAIATVASTEETNKREFLKALKENLGFINLALDKCDIDKDTYYKWTQDEYFSMKVAEATEYAGDIAERMLFKKISEGDTQAIMFYCETKLRSRGYFKKS